MFTAAITHFLFFTNTAFTSVDPSSVCCHWPSNDPKAEVARRPQGWESTFSRAIMVLCYPRVISGSVADLPDVLKRKKHKSKKKKPYECKRCWFPTLTQFIFDENSLWWMKLASESRDYSQSIIASITGKKNICIMKNMFFNKRNIFWLNLAIANVFRYPKQHMLHLCLFNTFLKRFLGNGEQKCPTGVQWLEFVWEVWATGEDKSCCFKDRLGGGGAARDRTDGR